MIKELEQIANQEPGFLTQVGESIAANPVPMAIMTFAVIAGLGTYFYNKWETRPKPYSAYQQKNVEDSYES